jgi:hypothetical protein
MDKPVYLPLFLRDPGYDLTVVDADGSWQTYDLKEEITSHFPDTVDIGEDWLGDVVPLQVSHVYTELLHLEKIVKFD